MLVVIDLLNTVVALIFHKECQKLKLKHGLNDQLQRASSSIVLNLAEGAAKPTVKDRKRFYAIAFGSAKECKAILDLQNFTIENSSAYRIADHLAASTYRLMTHH